MRYHKKVYFSEQDIIKLKDLTDILNNKCWHATGHCLDNLKYRSIRPDDILLFIKDLKLQAENIFEYYTDEKNITKICYRISYINGLDLILVISNTKELITIYINTADDEHITLDKTLYTQKKG
jgi:hypothetical protein